MSRARASSVTVSALPGAAQIFVPRPVSTVLRHTAEAHVAGSASLSLEVGVRLALPEFHVCVHCIVAALASRLQPLWGYGAGPAIR